MILTKVAGSLLNNQMMSSKRLEPTNPAKTRSGSYVSVTCTAHIPNKKTGRLYEGETNGLKTKATA